MSQILKDLQIQYRDVYNNLAIRDAKIIILHMIEELGKLTRIILDEDLYELNKFESKQNSISKLVNSIIFYYTAFNTDIGYIFYNEFKHDSDHELLISLSTNISTLGREYFKGLPINKIVSVDIIQNLMQLCYHHDINFDELISSNLKQK